MKRASKFWFNNEKKVLTRLGFKPTPQSGGGWIHKEDGENDYSICQLKSTEKQSYKLNLLDLQKLVYHANMSNKLPLFIVEFLNDSTWIMVRSEDLDSFVKAYSGDKIEINNFLSELSTDKVEKEVIRHDIVVREEQEKDNLEDMFEKRKQRREKEKLWKKRRKS